MNERQNFFEKNWDVREDTDLEMLKQLSWVESILTNNKKGIVDDFRI